MTDDLLQLYKELDRLDQLKEIKERRWLKHKETCRENCYYKCDPWWKDYIKQCQEKIRQMIFELENDRT